MIKERVFKGKLAPETIASSAPSVLLDGKRILILENEPLIAMDLGDILVDAGASVEITAKPVEALMVLEHCTPSAAILDVNLQDGACEVICRRLIRSQVPFAFYTGFDRPDAWPEASTLIKPATRDDVIECARWLCALSTKYN